MRPERTEVHRVADAPLQRSQRGHCWRRSDHRTVGRRRRVVRRNAALVHHPDDTRR